MRWYFILLELTIIDNAVSFRPAVRCEPCFRGEAPAPGQYMDRHGSCLAKINNLLDFPITNEMRHVPLRHEFRDFRRIRESACEGTRFP
jgi:hypothetical protein